MINKQLMKVKIFKRTQPPQENSHSHLSSTQISLPSTPLQKDRLYIHTQKEQEKKGTTIKIEFKVAPHTKYTSGEDQRDGKSKEETKKA